MDVSIIIVNYNTKQLTSNCIDSILQDITDINYEIIVLDNASNDGSIDFFKEKYSSIQIISNPYNYGFGKANNIGAKHAKGKYLLFLNSDTIINENACLKFFNKMEENPEIASCGGNLMHANGLKNISYGNFPTLTMYFFEIGLKKFFDSYYTKELSAGCKAQFDIPAKIDYICGADIFIRKAVFDLLNGFDEEIFLYFEETDLFKRMQEKGFSSIIFPDINIIHLSGQSTKTRKQSSSNLYYRSKFYYFKKHHPNSIFLLLLFDFINSLKMIIFKWDFTIIKSIYYIISTK